MSLGPGQALNCLTHGVMYRTLRALVGVRRAHDTAGFYGSWLPIMFRGSCVIVIWVAPG
jgi:hypothetical protein